MQIHKLIKDTLKDHKNKIELAQWAIISGISSFVYPHYLMAMKQKKHPTELILVPKIKDMSEFLAQNGPFMDRLSDQLIDNINTHPLIMKYRNSPELVLFNNDNIEIFKTIFDLYIIPNIGNRITSVISKKFGLDDPSKRNVFIEDKSIDFLYRRMDITDDEFKFLVDEIVLHYITLLPTMKKHAEDPERNLDITMTEDEILFIVNDNGICPILFNESIIENEAVMPMLSFVTGTTFSEKNATYKSAINGKLVPARQVTTGVFNKVSLITLEGCNQIIGKEDVSGAEA